MAMPGLLPTVVGRGTELWTIRSASIALKWVLLVLRTPFRVVRDIDPWFGRALRFGLELVGLVAVETDCGLNGVPTMARRSNHHREGFPWDVA